MTLKDQVILFLFGLSIISLQGQNTFFSFPKKGTTEYIYKWGNGYFSDIITSDTIIDRGQKYFFRIRKSFDGAIDTAFIREDEQNYYSADVNTPDYIEIPKNPKAGQKWYSIDSSWVYTVLSTRAELRTPVKSYKKVIELEARQNKIKNEKYHVRYLNYYKNGVGFIGSVVDHKLSCYLIEVKYSN